MHSLLARFKEIRQHTEQITQPLHKEDYVVQPVVDVSPPKWHLAHTTWFFETFVLKEFKDDYSLFNKDFGFLFNSYYETVGKRTLRVNRGNLTRPVVDEILAYRAYVNSEMSDLLNSFPNTNNRVEELKSLIELGLQHEQQHQELLITDIKYILGNNPIFPTYQKPLQHIKEHIEQKPNDFISIEEGKYEIGYKGNDFCFDNELGVHQVWLAPFRISTTLITNKEYLEFIEDGGYENFNYWLAEGWDWVCNKQKKAPEYWHFIEKEWMHFTLEGLQKISGNSPVTHVSFYEADAFANWKKMRLPTEFEWEVASKQLKYGQRWEWTNSAYLAYPEYKKAEGAIGEYNGKFMINQMVLRGGSCASSPNHLRYTYRNFFHPYLNWQYTGIRLAESL